MALPGSIHIYNNLFSETTSLNIRYNTTGLPSYFLHCFGFIDGNWGLLVVEGRFLPLWLEAQPPGILTKWHPHAQILSDDFPVDSFPEPLALVYGERNAHESPSMRWPAVVSFNLASSAFEFMKIPWRFQKYYS